MSPGGRGRARRALVDAALEAGRDIGAAAVFFHTTVAERLGLGANDIKALDLLQREGPMTPKAMSEMTGLAPASVTAMCDRLEAKGLLRRSPHPHDGRRVLVGIHESAFELLSPSYRDLGEALTDVLADYDDDALALVAEVFAAMARRQRELGRLLTGDPQRR